jgi:hypothetical protein
MSDYVRGGLYVPNGPPVNAGIPTTASNMKFSQYYGATKVFVYTPTLYGYHANYNMRLEAIAAGWDQIAPLHMIVTLAAGAIVYSANTSDYAFTFGGGATYTIFAYTGAGYPATGMNSSAGFPEGSYLEVILNNGSLIVGAGGKGGGSPYVDTNRDPAKGIGSIGGNAVNVDIGSYISGWVSTFGMHFPITSAYPLTSTFKVTNNGTIASGGGGGGAGWVGDVGYWQLAAASAGGGAGYVPGLHGDNSGGTLAPGFTVYEYTGSDGSMYSAGGGAWCQLGASRADAGAGGGWGMAGNSGSGYAWAVGGQPGICVSGSANLVSMTGSGYYGPIN